MMKMLVASVVMIGSLSCLPLNVAVANPANTITSYQTPVQVAGLFDFLKRDNREQRYDRRYNRGDNRRYRDRRSRSDQRYQEDRRYSQQQHDRRYSNDRRQRTYSRNRNYQAAPAPIKKRYGEKLCEQGKYECITVKSGDSWKKLFPDENQRELAMRLNRTNQNIRAGMKIVKPPEGATLLDIAPLPTSIETNNKKLIMVNLPKLAWAAYDENGDMVKWGPVSGGKDFCPDIGKPCNTIQGVFAVFNKKGSYCKSGTFPAGEAGAPMPYCMFFHSGFAMHGSNEVPGYNASHGCVRMYKEDAKWLNEEFVEMPPDEYINGTEVIVQVDPRPDDIALANQEEQSTESPGETVAEQEVDTRNYNQRYEYEYDRDYRRHHNFRQQHYRQPDNYQRHNNGHQPRNNYRSIDPDYEEIIY